jgi:parallel beta helix pectate lyase-like protein
MSKVRFTLNLLAVAVFVLTVSSMANAQASRTWVSGVGDDVNPCSRTAPCKTFAGAMSKTANGGEIDALDPAGFGAVSIISKSITIDGGDGSGFGGILASSTTGVTVNGAGAVVTLRRLSINGGPPNLPGTNGVRFIQGSKLRIEECKIFNFVAVGTGFGLDIALATAATVAIKDSTIYNNNKGIRATTSSGVLLITLENSTVQHNVTEGALLNTGAFLEARNSNISYNVTGVSLTSANSGADLIHCDVIANTGTGLAAGPSTFTRIGGSSFIGNATGISQSAANNVKTFGDNYIVDSITGGAIQFVAPQ